VEYRTYEHGYLSGILALCEAEGWPSLPADPARAHGILTNPGVTTWVADDSGTIVGFVTLLSDGALQAYMANLVVAIDRRRQGIGGRLVEEAFARCGAERIDLLSLADEFYERLPHRRMSGFRLYPPFLKRGDPAW
jgi:ribosomal protein S18 acetylase RimI-like enzyme